MRVASKINGTLLIFALSLVLVGTLGCGKKKRTTTMPYIPPTTDTGGTGGFIGGGSCGGVGGYPISRDQSGTPFYANLTPQSGGYYGGSYYQSAIELSLFYADATSNNIVGSANLNIDIASLLGYPPGSIQQQQICASSIDPYTGQSQFGTGYEYGQYFIIQQLVLRGSIQLPSYQSQYIPYPITVVVGGQCQTYINQYTRRLTGCVAVYIGQSQYYMYIAQ